MINTETRPPFVAVALAAAGILALAGCAASSQPAGPGMMNSGTSGSGYQYSRLRCSAPAYLPGRVVGVTLADMGMNQMMGGTAPMGARMMLQASVTSVAAGQVTFVAQNMGWRTHELVVLPLPPDSVAGQRVPTPDGKVDETGSLGEASANCVGGTGHGVPGGAVTWVTLTLAPGHYELVCNLTNHYADGMHQEFTVTSG